MAKKPNTAVATVKKNAVATAAGPAVPAFMKGHAGRGIQGLGTADMEIPRIKLLQAVSKELEEQDHFKPGMFYHTILQDVIGGEQELTLIPIYIDKRYILWRPRWDGGGILARADDGVSWKPGKGEFTVRASKDTKRTVTWKLAPTVDESGLAEWGSFDPDNEDSQPAATLMYNIVCYLPDFPQYSPCVLTLQRSTVKAAKKLIGKISMSGAPSYGLKFTATPEEAKNASGDDFLALRLTGDGFVEDEELFQALAELHDRFAKDGVQIRDIEGLQEDDGAGEASASDAGIDKKTGKRKF